MPMPWTLNSRAVLLALALCAPAAQAAQGDRTRPLAIENDGGGVFNAQTRRTEFSGKVLLTQGSLQMRANRLEAQQREDSSVFVLAQGSPGEPVRFEQARDVPGERIAGQAERIEYDSAAETVRFVGGATVRRLRNGQVADEVTGAVIVYSSRAETFAVEGGQTAPQPGGRVRVIMMPRDAAAAPTPASGVPLKTTPALTPASGQP